MVKGADGEATVLDVTDVKVPVSVAVVARGKNGMGSPFAAAAEAITDGSRVAPTLDVKELTIDDRASVEIPVGTINEVKVTPGITTPCGSVKVACAATPVIPRATSGMKLDTFMSGKVSGSYVRFTSKKLCWLGAVEVCLSITRVCC